MQGWCQNGAFVSSELACTYEIRSCGWSLGNPWNCRISEAPEGFLALFRASPHFGKRVRNLSPGGSVRKGKRWPTSHRRDSACSSDVCPLSRVRACAPYTFKRASTCGARAAGRPAGPPAITAVVAAQRATYRGVRRIAECSPQRSQGARCVLPPSEPPSSTSNYFGLRILRFAFRRPFRSSVSARVGFRRASPYL